MNGDQKPLAVATALVGLLAGVVAGVYMLGGVVIALRLLFDHFALNTVVVILGQLPREPVISTALLNVIGPALTVGLLAALVYGAFDGPRPRAWPSDELDRGPRWRLILVFIAFVSVALTMPAILQALRTDGISPLLLTSLLGIAVTFGLAASGWFLIRRIGRRRGWLRLPKAAAAGGVWAAIAVTPAVMLASSLPFEKAQICTSAGQEREVGLLIGEGGGRILLEQHFGGEASVVSLPADKMTKGEFGDLSSTFACPVPPGQAAVAKIVEAKLGGHGGELERRLATELRPRLRFDRGERWRPLEVGSFLGESFPRGARHGACEAGKDPPCPPAEGLSQLRRGEGAPAYIDIHGEARNGADYGSPLEECGTLPPAADCNGGAGAAIYYRRTTHDGRWYWDYWWFMRYSDYTGSINQCLTICGDHEGDWEGVTVITTAAANPEIVGAIYAAHSERVLVDGAMLPLSGGHPTVYVARGTHASYPFDCDRGCRQYSTRAGVRLPEDPHDGAVPWGGNRDRECATYECVLPLPEIGRPGQGALPRAGGWAGWRGRWGETCHGGCRGARAGHEGSPASPGLQTRFACPWVPTRRALPAPDGSGLSTSEVTGDRERLLSVCRALRGGG
ncbi:MAG TPA: hypothetical protein VK889_02580 [Solirubrobacterales bacterium]|nr:hypothetical protein [Solirubrobacterales bacterium]